MVVAETTLTPELLFVKFKLGDYRLRKLTRWCLWCVILRVEHDAMSTFYVAVIAILRGGP